MGDSRAMSTPASVDALLGSDKEGALALTEDTSCAIAAIVVGVNIHSMAKQLDDSGQISLVARKVQRREA
jgi:hypothetical protein